MKLLHISTDAQRGMVNLRGDFEQREPARQSQLVLSFPQQWEAMLSDLADPFVPALLMPAMATGEPLEIHPPVSSQLIDSLEEIQRIYSTWYPEVFRQVEVTAHQPVSTPVAPKPAVGVFFSLGVDSFYTLLTHNDSPKPMRPRITHLIYMRGIESFLENSEGVDETERLVREVAQACGLECIVGETNLRTHFKLDWAYHYVGPGLATVALALGGGLGRVLVPGHYSYRVVIPSGTSPLVDRMWSNPHVRIVHDGCERERAQKIADVVGQSPLALRYLRVCTSNKGGPRNCGQCSKCIRTMISLHAVGQLANATTFPSVIPNTFRTKLKLRDEDRLFAEENLRLLQRTKRCAELEREMQAIFQRDRKLQAAETLLEDTPMRIVLPMLRRLWRP